MKESKQMQLTECAGTPNERGLQYGEAGRANLQKMYNVMSYFGNKVNLSTENNKYLQRGVVRCNVTY